MYKVAANRLGLVAVKSRDSRIVIVSVDKVAVYIYPFTFNQAEVYIETLADGNRFWLTDILDDGHRANSLRRVINDERLTIIRRVFTDVLGF